MKNEVILEKIPFSYPLCFNGSCQQRDRCLHYLAGAQKPADSHHGPAVYPSAWQDGHCRYFNEKKLAKMAWGFTRLYDNMPHYLRAEARRRVSKYFSNGCGPYYRYHHGQNKLSPSQQADIMKILSEFGSTESLAFDHYETTYDFT